jgi:hypothetical protein
MLRTAIFTTPAVGDGVATDLGKSAGDVIKNVETPVHSSDEDGWRA